MLKAEAGRDTGSVTGTLLRDPPTRGVWAVRSTLTEPNQRHDFRGLEKWTRLPLGRCRSAVWGLGMWVLRVLLDGLGGCEALVRW